MEKMCSFSINRKYNVIEFKNTYWYPIDDFKRPHHDTTDKFISDGIFHLSKKSWISDSLLRSIADFCKKEYPDLDFDYTFIYIEERRNYLKETFEGMIEKRNGYSKLNSNKGKGVKNG